MKTLKHVRLNLFLVLVLFAALLNTEAFGTNKLGESYTGVTFPPTGWRTQHVSGLAGGGAWFRSTSNFKSAPACAESDGTLLADNFLITKKITPAAGDSLVFYVSSNYLLGAVGRLDVKVSTTDSLAASFIDFVVPFNLGLQLLTPNVYVRQAISLSAYAGQNIFLAFRHIEVVGLGAVRIDGAVVGGVDLNLTVLMEVHRGVGIFPVPRRDRDTVTVSIRDLASPHAIIDVRKAYLDTLGKKAFNFTMPEVDVNYYVVVEHRNSLRTWSDTLGEVFAGGALTYDFSSNISQAFNSNERYVGPDACTFSGDITQDGFIDLSDLIPIYNDNVNFVNGPYVLTDLNWDMYPDLQDIITCHNNNVLFIHEQKPS